MPDQQTAAFHTLHNGPRITTWSQVLGDLKGRRQPSLNGLLGRLPGSPVGTTEQSISLNPQPSQLTHHGAGAQATAVGQGTIRMIQAVNTLFSDAMTQKQKIN